MSVPCAHEHCPNDAILSVKASTGWANLCRNHYELRISADAREFCQRNGLLTRAQQFEFIRQRLTAMRSRGIRATIPGILP